MKSHVDTSWLTVVLCLYVFSASLNASDEVQAISKEQYVPGEDFQLVGKGMFRWLWFDLYLAKLSTPSGDYQPQQWPLSLELIYAREITKVKLVQTTEAEWQRQGIQYQSKWLSQLNRIWPDISTDDRLMLYVDPKVTSHFYHNGQKIGSIDDQYFAPAFTAIWLSDDTLKPKLRNQLTGSKP